jgi:uncharacterized protein YuzE
MTRRTIKDRHNPDITLRELRDLAAKKQPPEEQEMFGPSQFIYIELGSPPLTSAPPVGARETVADDEVLLHVDRHGRIYGIEIGIAADNL